MLLTDGPLSFREFMTHEDLPLATIFREVFSFLSGRSDAVLFGAQAVNAYCATERMTQDVDVLATDAKGLAEALRAHLAAKFHIALRIREVAAEQGLRIYQVRKPRNRHLADLRQVARLPAFNQIAGVRVATPEELVVMKVRSLAARRDRPKGDTDRADLHRLLLAYPQLKVEQGLIAERLRDLGATAEALTLWGELARALIVADEDDGF